MFNKELYPDFIFDYQGMTMKVEPTEIGFNLQMNEPTQISLEGVLRPIDKEELNNYNQYKEIQKMYDFPEISLKSYEIDSNFLKFDNLNEKENKMSLAKKYIFNKKDESDKQAIKQGALDEDGTLTEQGKDLLLNLLLQDKDIRTKFNLALTTIAKDDKDGE